MFGSKLMRPALQRAGRAAGARRAPAAPPLHLRIARQQLERPLLKPYPHTRHVVAYATDGKHDGEKSWGEIAAEAADVAKSVFDKVKSGASAALEAISKPKPEAPLDRSDRAGPRERDLPQSPLGPLFGDGFLGRAVGGMVASAVKSLGEQMAQQARETRGVFEDAAAAIRASPDVAARMGGAVVVGDPISQSSSSSSINGRVTKRVVLVLPVTGPGGRLAQAQVVSTETAGNLGSTDITVILPGGETIRVTGSGGGGRGGGRGPSSRYTQGGEVIDAEWTDVKS